uniref:C2H2-type domain-containing protein n=1 Tax=Wuchereria bancrofti TaxID=6293 RepID=A0A1I8EA24_WUCBA
MEELAIDDGRVKQEHEFHTTIRFNINKHVAKFIAYVITTNGWKKKAANRWFEKINRNEIFLHAVEKEMLMKWTAGLTNNEKLVTFLQSIYEKEARLHPLSIQYLSVNGSFVLPKAIFIPPSQVVLLVAEYDADMTIQELIRRLVTSGKIKEQERRIRYAENLLVVVVNQRRAMHMTKILFELGRNVVANSLGAIEDTEKVLVSRTLPPMLKCHLCNFKTESLIILEAHKEIPHYVRHRYRCSYCIQFFVNFHGIRNHFLRKHHVIARSDYQNTYTMFATKKQASCAVSEIIRNTEIDCDLSHQKSEHCISRKQVNQEENGFIRKGSAQRWIQEDFSTEDFISRSIDHIFTFYRDVFRIQYMMEG